MGLDDAHPGDSSYTYRDVATHTVFGIYLNSSFWLKSTAEFWNRQPIPNSHWLDALWQIHRTLGRKDTDALVAATIKSMRSAAGDPRELTLKLDFDNYCFRHMLDGHKALDDPTGVKLRAILNAVSASKISLRSR